MRHRAPCRVRGAAFTTLLMWQCRAVGPGCPAWRLASRVTRGLPAAGTAGIVVRLVVRCRLLQGLLERVLVKARRVEWVPAAPVRQRQPRRLTDVIHAHLVTAMPRGV